MWQADIVRSTSIKSLHETAAERIFSVLTMLLRNKDKVFIALSGGTTPQKTYELLASPQYSSRIFWKRLHFFQVDERYVPVSDPASNSGMIRRSLINLIPLPQDNFHPIDTTLSSPAESASQYEILLSSCFGIKKPTFPRFDLILLGMGTDGHIASLFPGDPALSENSRWVVPVNKPIISPSVNRISLTLPVINNSEHIFLLLSGKSKTAIIDKMQMGNKAISAFPVALVSARSFFTCIMTEAEM